ncbi:MAG: hypothetical protein MJ252_24990, partial [archaeon]|nr:hypothetical protein [archaeon]
ESNNNERNRKIEEEKLKEDEIVNEMNKRTKKVSKKEAEKIASRLYNQIYFKKLSYGVDSTKRMNTNSNVNKSNKSFKDSNIYNTNYQTIKEKNHMIDQIYNNDNYNTNQDTVTIGRYIIEKNYLDDFQKRKFVDDNSAERIVDSFFNFRKRKYGE